MSRLVLFLLSACAIGTPAVAQESAASGKHLQRRLSVVLGAGPILGGPGAGLADQLRAAGYDGTNPQMCGFPGPCIEPRQHPITSKPLFALIVSARFAISERFSIGAGRFLWNHSLGGASGFRRDGTTLSDFAHSDSDTYATWVLLAWKPTAALRLGGGPGWFRVKESHLDRLSLLGTVVEGGVETGVSGTLFVDVSARLHLVPTRDIVVGASNPITLRPQWRHGVLAVGVGARF